METLIVRSDDLRLVQPVGAVVSVDDPPNTSPMLDSGRWKSGQMERALNIGEV